MTGDLQARTAHDALVADIAAIYAHYRPALVAGFAEFVHKQGYGARVPLALHNAPVPVKMAGLTWQTVGRRLYGADFDRAFMAILERKPSAKQG